jgi:class 3 adenylate cyclase
MRLILMLIIQLVVLLLSFAGICCVFAIVANHTTETSARTNLLRTVDVVTAEALQPFQAYINNVAVLQELIRMRNESITQPQYLHANRMQRLANKEAAIAMLKVNPLTQALYETYRVCNNSDFGDSGFYTGTSFHHYCDATGRHQVVFCSVTPTTTDGWPTNCSETDYVVNSADYEYGAVVRDMPINATERSVWTRAYTFPAVDGAGAPTGTFNALLTLMSVDEFDPVTGRGIHALGQDLNIAFMSLAMRTIAASGLDVTIVDQRDGQILGWSYDRPIYDPTTTALLIAGSTGYAPFDNLVHAVERELDCSFLQCKERSVNEVLTLKGLEEKSARLAVLQSYSQSQLKLLLLVSAPRDMFFGAGEQAMAIGITVGVVAFAATTVTSVLLWLALKRPLSVLIGHMWLAARFRGNELSDTERHQPLSSNVTEVQSVIEAFGAMNQQLISAKPFVPMAVIKSLNAGEDADDEGDLEDSMVGADAEHNAPLPGTGSGRPSITHETKSKASRTKDSDTAAHDDNVSTRSSASSRSGAAHGAYLAVHKIDSGMQLDESNVAVIVMRIRGFGQILRERSRGGIVSLYGEALSVIYKAVIERRGVLEVHGDVFFASFNAVSRVASAPMKAAGAALAARKALESMRLSLLAGISSGTCLVGNVGCPQLRQFATLGPVPQQAEVLQRLAVIEGAGVMTSLKVALDVSSSFHYKVLGRLPPTAALSGLDVAMLYLPPEVATTQTRLPAQPSDDTGDGEWLYDVGRIEATNPHKSHNERVINALKMPVSSPSAREAGAPLFDCDTGTPDQPLGRYFEECF